MEEVPFDQLLARARACYTFKTKWHFHILTPTCHFNSGGTQYIILFENEVTGEKVQSSFSEKPLTEGQKLEELFYGRV
jgi:hypothetical protein